MKGFIYILLAVFLISSCNQKSKNKAGVFTIEKEIQFDSLHDEDYAKDSLGGESIFYVIEEMPIFGSGDKDLLKYIVDNTNYPSSAINAGIEGRVYIKFIINEDGSVSNPEIMRGIDNDLDEECIRVIKNMPNWVPGKQMGKLVKVSYAIPFTFRLDSDSDSEKGNTITPKKDNKEKIIDFKIYPNPATDIANIEIYEFKADLEYQL